MASYVVMPKLDADMDHGQILAWQKGEGDWVKQGDTLLTLKTGTVIAAVNAATEGALLAILVNPGKLVPVDMPIAILGQYGEAVHPMMAKARELLGDLMVFDAVTGATEKMKTQIPLDELHCVPPANHPGLGKEDKQRKK